jgi:hypothetical protein
LLFENIIEPSDDVDNRVPADESELSNHTRLTKAHQKTTPHAIVPVVEALECYHIIYDVELYSLEVFQIPYTLFND